MIHHTYSRGPPIPYHNGVPVTNKGFPSFGITRDGINISALKSYHLPELVLRRVAAECDSDLREKGRLDDRLQSMNGLAIKTLHRIFVDCEDDGAGRFARYRFYAYMSSAFYKREMLVDESIPGESARSRRFPVAVKDNGVYVAVAYNKSTGGPVSTREARRFYDMVDDVKRGEHGAMLSEAIYGSSVGVGKGAIKELRALVSARPGDGEDVVSFRVAAFEGGIHLVTPVP